MTVHLPTLKQLQYLVALRRHGHFGRAAEACFVTQSTLSAGLRELETQLGITLVERTRRVVRFTPLGQKISDKALSACNRPELRAEATMMGTSLHTLVQMVDNGLGQTFVPAMAIGAGILDGTGIVARPLRSNYNYRRIALAWRKSSPREEEFT